MNKEIQPTGEQIILTSWNPIQAAFQSIGAQLIADPRLAKSLGPIYRHEPEETIMALLIRIMEENPDIADNGELEDKFWNTINE